MSRILFTNILDYEEIRKTQMGRKKGIFRSNHTSCVVGICKGFLW
nr:MAG TPA: hypothetical protein [Caudoviricetes sp.]